MLRRPALRLAALVVLLAGFLIAPASFSGVAAPAGPGEPFKLSGDLPREADVDWFSISPGGQYAVYPVSRYGAWQGRELYSVPVTGGAPVRLDADTVGTTQIGFSPDGSRVLFTDNWNGDLFSVPPGGPASAAIRLNPAFPDGSGVQQFFVGRNGERVAYLRDGGSYGKLGLYSVPTGGPADAGSLLAEAPDIRPAFSPDSSRILYVAMKTNSYDGELFSVPSAGPASAAVKLNGPLIGNGGVVMFAFSADGQRVSYLAVAETPDVYELYSVPLLGGQVTKLSRPLGAGERVMTYVYCGTQVVYGVFGPAPTQFYRVPLTGPANASVPVGCSLAQGESGGDLRCAGDRVTYTVRRGGVMDLYSAPLSGPGGKCTRLTQPFIGDGSRSLSWFSFTGNLLYVTYFDDSFSILGITYPHSIHYVPLEGPASENITLTLGEMKSGKHEINWRGDRLLYASVVSNGPSELYSVPLPGPADLAAKLNGPLVSGGDVSGLPGEMAYAAGGRVAVYIADAEIDGKRELYAVADVPPEPLPVQLYLPLIIR